MKKHGVATRGAAALAGLAGLALVAAPAALAKDGDVRKVGSCTGATAIELKLSDEDGRIEVELEVDQGRSGVVWSVTLKHDGQQVMSGQRTTRGRSGSFTVRRVVSDRQGRDRLVGTASRGGESCRVSATW